MSSLALCIWCIHFFVDLASFRFQLLPESSSTSIFCSYFGSEISNSGRFSQFFLQVFRSTGHLFSGVQLWFPQKWNDSEFRTFSFFYFYVFDSAVFVSTLGMKLFSNFFIIYLLFCSV